MSTITPFLLKQIIVDQREQYTLPVGYMARNLEKKLADMAKNKEITVLTGVRRCGKSVLLQHIRQQMKDQDCHFNFEDERLVTFTLEDFQTLYEGFMELYGPQKTFYFDEVQNIPGWEKFVRRLYNGNNKIFITGSNANLFSEELGTHLTGRYITLSVYPFSFREIIQEKFPESITPKPLSTTQIGKLKKLFNEYYIYGGIPEYYRLKQPEYLHSLYDSIIYRDIVARYKISNPTALRQLVFYLASNNSKETTFNSLRKFLGLGSSTTVSDYCNYLENSYLCFFLTRYSDSVKSQQQSPKKVYFIDHALAKIVGFRFSEDAGRVLENIVFIELKRRGFDLFYHREKKECDFIVWQHTKAINAIQVCQSMATAETKQREVDGLLEALERFSLKQGTIITQDGEGVETLQRNNKRYKIITTPLWKWLLEQ